MRLEEILEILNERNTNRYIILEEYYRSKHKILEKVTDKYKPNNKLINNYAKYITDVNLGYFLGKPVTYQPFPETEKKFEQVQDIFNYNDEQATNMVTGKQASIKGVCYELLYLDEEKKIRFNTVEPDNMVIIYDKSITPVIKYAIRYSKLGEEKGTNSYEFIEVYDDKHMTKYVNVGNKLVAEAPIEHYFDDVPVVVYKNNDELMGDFEVVLSLIDAYNKSQSETADDNEYFSDAYLKIRNLSGTSDEDISNMRKNRTILVDGDGDAEFLTKNVNSIRQDSFVERLQNDIHKFSMTPDLTDEKFGGNLSGIALEFKLWGLEQLASQKERLFKKGLQRRLELIDNCFEFQKKEFDWREVEITFRRNIPTNLADLVDMVSKLKGIISDETLLTQLPFIEDSSKELQRLKEEATDKVDLSFTDDEDLIPPKPAVDLDEY